MELWTLTPTLQEHSPTEELFFNSSAYFDSILEGIAKAQFRIDLEVYIYETRGIALRITEALGAAAKRGVQVRVLVDGIGVASNFSPLANALLEQGAQVRIFRPLPWRIRQWRFSLSALRGMERLWYLLAYLNHRNHRKMLLIDRECIWLGSVNMSQSHLPKQTGGQSWRDTAIKVKGVDLKLPEEAFELVWNRARKRHQRQVARTAQRSRFLLNFTRYLRSRNQRQLRERIASAHTRIWVTNAYFAPDAPLIKALETAAQRKVDVRVLLPARSDVFFMPWVSAYFYERLLEKGVSVYEYTPSMLHSKSLIIDDWACVGSSNMNRRSLIFDLEIDYQIQTDQSLQGLLRQFEQDLSNSNKMNREQDIQSRRWKRWIGAMLLVLLGRWL